MMNDNPLSTSDDWAERWAEARVSTVRFDPLTPMYRDFHHRVLQYLPRCGTETSRFLEIGAYPGYLMWYFQRYFGYQVSGLEYVHWCCDHARALLSKEGITAEFIEADLFAFDRQDEGEKWDVVASSGFIEHFSDSAGPLHRHLRLLRKKGYLVILVPNHATVYGAIMRQVAPRKYVTHNRMSLRDAIDALHRAGSCEILFSGYIGRLGFWNCCLYESARQKLGRGYPILRAPLWLIEHAAQWVMPNSSLLSPSFLLIAQKN